MPRTTTKATEARDRVRARFRTFSPAPAPNDDPTVVKTNLSEEEVRVCQNTLAYHVAHHDGSKIFGNNEARRLKLVEAYVRPRDNGEGDVRFMRTDDLEAVTVCELTVGEGMLNVHGSFSGACATLIVDLATFSPLLLLSAITGIDALGFSTSMNIVWHAPAALGATLRFVSTSLSLKGRTASSRCEAYDKKNGTLVISATHIVAPVQSLPLMTKFRTEKHGNDDNSRAKL